MRADHPSVRAAPVPVAPEPTDTRPNRAARRGKRSAVVPAPSHGRGGAPHARGAQGRRIIPVRRTG